MSIKFVRNTAGFNALRKSFDAEAKAKAERIEAAANAIPSTTQPAATEPYYETVDASDEARPRYRVKTTGPRSQRHEVKTQALLRARAAVAGD